MPASRGRTPPARRFLRRRHTTAPARNERARRGATLAERRPRPRDVAGPHWRCANFLWSSRCLTGLVGPWPPGRSLRPGDFFARLRGRLVPPGAGQYPRRQAAHLCVGVVQRLLQARQGRAEVQAGLTRSAWPRRRARPRRRRAIAAATCSSGHWAGSFRSWLALRIGGTTVFHRPARAAGPFSRRSEAAAARRNRFSHFP